MPIPKLKWISPIDVKTWLRLDRESHTMIWMVCNLGKTQYGVLGPCGGICTCFKVLPPVLHEFEFLTVRNLNFWPLEIWIFKFCATLKQKVLFMLFPNIWGFICLSLTWPKLQGVESSFFRGKKLTKTIFSP